MGVVLFVIVAILYVISGYHLVTVYYRSQGVRTVLLIVSYKK